MAVSVLSLTNCPAGTATAAVPLPMKAQNFNGMGASILVNFSGVAGSGTSPATGTVSVQVSNDPNANPSGPSLSPSQIASARWNNHDTLKLLTTDQNSSIIYPIAYVRLYANAPVSGTVSAFIGIPDQL